MPPTAPKPGILFSCSGQQGFKYPKSDLLPEVKNMHKNSSDGQIKYLMPGASEVHPLKHADYTEKRAMRERRNSPYLSEASIFYMKLILLLGTLFLAYGMFGPHF
jgi:hypothetical protein